MPRVPDRSVAAAPFSAIVAVEFSPGLLDVLAGVSPARRPTPLDIPSPRSGKITRNKHEAASPGRDAASTTSNSGPGSDSGCVHDSAIA